MHCEFCGVRDTPETEVVLLGACGHRVCRQHRMPCARCFPARHPDPGRGPAPVSAPTSTTASTPQPDPSWRWTSRGPEPILPRLFGGYEPAHDYCATCRAPFGSIDGAWEMRNATQSTPGSALCPRCRPKVRA
jgi:hypothetical protein